MAKKLIKKRNPKKQKYTCEVCGLVVSVDEVCDCVDICDIVCCGKQMKPKK